MIIDNGERASLIIDGVFDGVAGVQGAHVSFIPNRMGKAAAEARAGVLNGVPVLLTPVKDLTGPFWTSRFQVIE